MKSQISRDSFQPERHYSGVYLQQGRMILDADWNELTDIQKAALAAALRDAVGGGAPRTGGLALVDVAGPGDPPDIRIRPGALYVEGVPARLEGSAPVAIAGQPDYPIQAAFPAQSVRLYADVWERTVTALQEPGLMDAALHGADTATRSRTMLQVKWCDAGDDPLDAGFNPPLGDAPLSLKLNLVTSAGDKCDPCASQVKADERIGNYLFRVEVHDYNRKTRQLTLKWSRDNGAEACATAAMPTGFGQGEWLWEYYDDDTERLLGNHFAAGPAKLRGLIKDSCTAPIGADEPKTYVRQWDGAIRIDLGSGVPDPAFANRDRGIALATGAAASQAHGRVDYSAATGVLRINLERLELTLATKGRDFVPGDYWLAPVREAEDASGDFILKDAPPRGVRHHYLTLGEIAVTKKLAPLDDAGRRRMAFPPLTDLTARDVGFSDHCTGLYAGAKNVQDALDILCAIDASDIAYPLPGCGGNTVRDRLKALFDPDGDNKLTVKAALDILLCQLDAGHLPYSVPACADAASLRGRLGLAAGASALGPVIDTLLCELDASHLPIRKPDAALCSDLQSPSVVSVQDALRVLCEKSGGCAVTVTSPEHLGILLAEFAQSSAKELWLCLKAGTYPLGEIPEIAGKTGLRLSGEGAESTRIVFSGAKLAIEADSAILENLAFTFATGTGQVAIRAVESRTAGCRFARTGTAKNGPAMLSVGGQGSASCRLDWQGNTLYAQVKTVAAAGGIQWAGAEVVGDAAVSAAILGLAQEALLNDKAAYDEALAKVAGQVVGMPKSARTSWKAKLDKIAVTRASISHTAGTASMSEMLAGNGMTTAEAAAAIEDMVAQWVTYDPDWALRLETAKVGGTLAGNVVDGWLLLGNGVAGYRSPDAGIDGTTLTGSVVKAGGGELRLDGNRLVAVKANLAAGSFNAARALTKQADGYARLFLAGNSLAEPANALVAASFVGQGNTWYRAAGTDAPTGSVIGDRASFTGNLLEGSAEKADLTGTVKAARLASTGNVLIDLVPPAS